MTARLIAPWLSERLGQQFVVENALAPAAIIALERHGFKLLFLYNEIAALRNRIKELRPEEAPQGTMTEDDHANRLQPLKYALQRKNHKIEISSACPEKAFIQTTLNTRDLWNTESAQVAFDVMYRTTAELLEKFDFTGAQKSAHVALIRKGGTYIFDHDF
jgi:hypothetical protein